MAFNYLLVLALVASALAAEKIVFNNTIAYPMIELENIPRQILHKKINHTFVKYIPEVDFEISSKLFVNEGKIDKDDIYNESAYNMATERSHCRIYPTDFKMDETIGIFMEHRPRRVVVIEGEADDFTGLQAGRGYASMDNGKILQFEIQHTRTGAYYGEPQLQKIRSLGYLDLQIPNEKAVNLLNVNNKLYIITRNTSHYYSQTQNKIYNVSGFGPHDHLIRIKTMEDENNQTSELVAITKSDLTVYKFISDTMLEKKHVISDFGVPKDLYQIVYDAPYFYIAADENVIIVDFSDRQKPKISTLRMNGTCYDVEKFKSTLHVSCLHNRMKYIAEFQARGSRIFLNRYYTDIEIPSTNFVRRIGESTMALVGDEEIRILNYGINRNLLLELPRRQPNFMFHFPKGIDIVPLHNFHDNGSFALLGVYKDRIRFMKLRHRPAELYCDFPNDKPGFIYSFLMKFNSTHCNYTEGEAVTPYGSTESYCEISVPLQVVSRRKMLQAKAGNLLTALVILVMVAAIAVIIGFGVKYNKINNQKIDQILHKIKQAKKKGYSSGAKPI